MLNRLRILKAFCKLCLHDGKRFLTNSMVLDVNKTQERLLGLIVARQHVVEKGLTMPETRLGFGKDNLQDLIKLCETYEKKKFDCKHEQFVSAISVIKEYLQYHIDRNYILDADLESSIRSFVSKYPDVKVEGQLSFTSNEFFKDVYSSFDLFANSRHSIRNYSKEEICYKDLKKVIELAQTAPSACNRQPVRVHICSKELGQELLKFHKGNRGFGELADKVLVITCDLSSYMNIYERNCVYVDGGIFVMNLLYALHFYKIGACVLNWSCSIDNDNIVRDLLSLSDSEEIISLITIGNLPERFSVARSGRILPDKVLLIHE